jgi:hypothetical protein
MKREAIGTFELPKIELPILKDMGFVFDQDKKVWILNVGNPLVWYEIELPEHPTWPDFRQGLCKVIDSSFEDGLKQGKQK